MKEQLERMFPGAVVTVSSSLRGVVTDGPVTIDVRFHGVDGLYSTRSTFQHFKVGEHARGVTMQETIDTFRESVRRESVMAPTKTARARAARVLRVLDAAKVGEVTL